MSYIFFCSHKESANYPQFSNWFSHSYTGYNGKLFTCVEQEFMYVKALTFGDQLTAAKIMFAVDAKQIKQLGREVQDFNEEKWNEVREQAMYNAVKSKFQDQQLKSILLSTGDNEIVEAADYDRIWGIGYSADTALANKDNWGQNLLGKILMRVREESK